MAGFGSGISSLGGLDSIGGIGGGGNGGDQPHMTVHRELNLGITVNRKVETWQGPYDKLCDHARGISLFENVDDPDLPKGSADTEAGGYGYPFVSDIKLVRENGNVGRMTITVTQNRQAAIVAVDFTEVQRPIKTWRADKEENAPDLAKIREWESWQETNWKDYAEFKGLQGDTKTLAEMIFKGIENYSVYAPVVSITLTTRTAPQLSLYPVGEANGAPEIPYGWKDIHDRSINDILNNLKRPGTTSDYTWVRASSRATPNADGTYQWVLQYQACDAVEEALFGT